jgi:hypothetical protein
VRLRDPFVRKHIHIFVQSFSDWSDHQSQYVERECSECGKKQHAKVPRDDWPESLWHLADVEWKDGVEAD